MAPAAPPLRARSEPARPVKVGAVLDRHDSDPAPVIVDTVDDAVVAAARAVKPLKAQLQWLADTIRARGQGAVQELDDRSRHFLRDPGQCPA